MIARLRGAADTAGRREDDGSAVVIALLITVSFVFVAWLVFFRFKWLTWSIPWAVFSGFFARTCC